MSPDLDFADTSKGITFFVPGLPAPGGSKRFVGIGRRTGRAILIDAAGERNTNWRQRVAVFARQVHLGPLLTGALRVQFTFHMPRPKFHYHASKKKLGLLKEDAPQYHTVKPDVLKLSRSTEDALTNVIWADDSANCDLHVRKFYADTPGCMITITPL